MQQTEKNILAVHFKRQGRRKRGSPGKRKENCGANATKQVFEAIKDLEEMDEENAKIEDTDSIYRLLAAVLNNNMGKVPVKAEDVEDYDIEECTAILKAYMEFVDELKADPN